MRRRKPAFLALTAIIALALIGVATWRLVGDGGADPYVAPRPTEQRAQPDPVGASRLLAELNEAWVDGDSSAAAQLGLPDTAASGQLAAIAGNVDAARLTDVTLRYVAEQRVTDDGWAAAVEVTWRYQGFDTASARAEVTFDFAFVDEQVRVRSVGGGSLRTPIWLGGPLQVSRTDETLVLVAGESAELSRYDRLARRAVPVVSQVLTDWPPKLVVEVPADLAGLEGILLARPDQYRSIAAVTGPVDGSTAPGSPVHVLVNPDVFDGLRGAGAQVVMSHEAVHVAVDDLRSQAPTWVVEGFADYVALRDVPLPLSVTARQIRQRVADAGLPTALPADEEFDEAAPHLGAIYEGAWLLCEVLADRGGEAALLRLSDQLARGAQLGPILRDGFDWTEAELVSAWRERLSDLPT